MKISDVTWIWIQIPKTDPEPAAKKGRNHGSGYTTLVMHGLKMS